MAPRETNPVDGGQLQRLVRRCRRDRRLLLGFVRRRQWLGLRHVYVPYTFPAGCTPLLGVRESLEIELPRYAEAVVHPCEFRAEPVVAGWHQRRPTVAELAKRRIELGLGLALHEQGD